MEMHILSWNVNGVRAWMKKQGTLDYVSRRNLDIVCLNETRIDSSLVEQVQKNFTMFPYQCWACSQRKGFAGVAVLSKTQPLSTEINFTSDLDTEGRVITLEFKDFYLVSSYFPNSGGGDQFIEFKAKWDSDFRDYLRRIMDRGKEVVWIGDLNIVGGELDYFEAKGRKIKIHPKERMSFDKFMELGFTDTFRHLNPGLRKYTWFSNKNPQNRASNKGWRIDFAMVTQGALSWVDNSNIHDHVLGSDHAAIELILNLPNLI